MLKRHLDCTCGRRVLMYVWLAQKYLTDGQILDRPVNIGHSLLNLLGRFSELLTAFIPPLVK